MLNRLIKRCDNDSFVDELFDLVCNEDAGVVFENGERYIFIKFDDFINAVFRSLS